MAAAGSAAAMAAAGSAAAESAAAKLGGGLGGGGDGGGGDGGGVGGSWSAGSPPWGELATLRLWRRRRRRAQLGWLSAVNRDGGGSGAAGVVDAGGTGSSAGDRGVADQGRSTLARGASR